MIQIIELHSKCISEAVSPRTIWAAYKGELPKNLRPLFCSLLAKVANGRSSLELLCCWSPELDQQITYLISKEET